jgi:nicotinic acid mononucleotide adenylyltransferase
MDKLFVIVGSDNRVQGFTRWEDYTQLHPGVQLIEIDESNEVWLSDKPQDYVYQGGAFVKA